MLPSPFSSKKALTQIKSLTVKCISFDLNFAIVRLVIGVGLISLNWNV